MDSRSFPFLFSIMKKFVSKSIISLSLLLEDGSKAHIAFTPQSSGGSVFYTNDEKLVAALHNHHSYAVRYREVAMPVEAPAPAPSKEEEKASEAHQIPFACNDDAKDYLAEHFGISRSKMRTRASIEEIAKSNGIEIVWNE